MDEYGSGGTKEKNNSGGGGGGRVGGYVDTSKADAPVWLMKCPPVVAQSLRGPSSSDSSLPVAKVVVSIDPLKDSAQPEVCIFVIIVVVVFDFHACMRVFFLVLLCSSLVPL